MTASKTDTRESEQSSGRAIKVRSTGLGYQYFRDQASGQDETVYIHQLLACLDHDPETVFHPDSYVCRLLEVPWLNTPENVVLHVAGEPWFDEDQIPEAGERSRAGVPESEYHRLHEVALDAGRSEVSRTLKRHVESGRGVRSD